MSGEDEELLELDPLAARRAYEGQRFYCIQLGAGDVVLSHLAKDDQYSLLVHMHECTWENHPPIPGLSDSADDDGTWATGEA